MIMSSMFNRDISVICAHLLVFSLRYGWNPQQRAVDADKTQRFDYGQLLAVGDRGIERRTRKGCVHAGLLL